MTPNAGRIERAVRGDADALDELAAEYRPLAFRTAQAVLGNPADADDVAQEAMIRLHASLPGFRGEAELGTWLYRVALNLSYDHLRRRRRARREQPLEGASLVSDTPRDPHRRVDAERARAAVTTALGTLPDEQRRPLELRFLSGLSYREIARVLDVPDGTVASRIYRALERLGAELESKHLEILR